MSIVSNVNPHREVTGAVVISTLSGDVLYSAPYCTTNGAPVAPQLLRAFQLVWDAVPDVLGALEGPTGKFDLMVKQAEQGAEEIVTYWTSGLSAGALCGVVARRLRALRAAVHPRHHTSGLTVTEVADDGTVDWRVVDNAAQVLNTLAAVRQDPWGTVRA